MSPPPVPIGEDDFHSVKSHANTPKLDSARTSDVRSPSLHTPSHPCPVFQAAFEESITEATDDQPFSEADPDPVSRRDKLLKAKRYDDRWVARWKQRPTAQHHPLMKLVAQIVFGVHLLRQSQAKSEEQVVKILQAHVNEIDIFLENTAADFDLAIADIDERIRHLKLPMEHLDVFKIMLDDDKFKSDLLAGNRKIEKIVQRTAKAKAAAMVDLDQGVVATQEMGKYLSRVEDKWPVKNRNVTEVFGAMRGNEHGWLGYLKDLKEQAKTLGKRLDQLSDLIDEMRALAMEAGEHERARSTAGSVTSHSRSSTPAPAPALRSKFSIDTNLRSKKSSDLNKPLPRAPKIGEAPIVSSIPSGYPPIPMVDRYDRPKSKQSRPKSSASNGRSGRNTKSTPDLRTSFSPSTADRSRKDTLSPLRSNPPQPRDQSSDRFGGTKNRTVDMQAFISKHKDSDRASSRDGSSIKYAYTQSLRSEPASPDLGNGFARRLSRRLMHLPPNERPRLGPDGKSLHSAGVSTPSTLRSHQTGFSVTSPPLASIYGEDDDGEAPTALPAFSQFNPPRSKSRNINGGSFKSLNVRSSVMAAKDRAMELRNTIFQRKGPKEEVAV